MTKYNFGGPGTFPPTNERGREIEFIFQGVAKCAGKPVDILDVGFAGSGYIEELLYRYPNISYTGLDGDAQRVSGAKLSVSPESKKGWKVVLSKIEYIVDNIVGYTSPSQYDIVMSISTVEHIVPIGYSNNHLYQENMDILAVESMKSLVKDSGYLLLTIPCGEERRYVSMRNPHKEILKRHHGYTECRHSLIIYDHARLDRIVDSWPIVLESYWINNGKEFVSAGKDKALTHKCKSSVNEAVCCIMLEKP